MLVIQVVIAISIVVLKQLNLDCSLYNAISSVHNNSSLSALCLVFSCSLGKNFVRYIINPLLHYIVLY